MLVVSLAGVVGTTDFHITKGGEVALGFEELGEHGVDIHILRTGIGLGVVEGRTGIAIAEEIGLQGDLRGQQGLLKERLPGRRVLGGLRLSRRDRGLWRSDPPRLPGPRQLDQSLAKHRNDRCKPDDEDAKADDGWTNCLHDSSRVVHPFRSSRLEGNAE